MDDWRNIAPKGATTKGIDVLDLLLLGIQTWECLLTLPFDAEVITRQRPWDWSVPVYWLTKAGALWFIILTNINQFSVKVNCQAAGDLANFMSAFASTGASALLMLRAISLWGRDIKVVVPLSVLNFGQWVIALHNAFIDKERLDPATNNCVLVKDYWSWIQVQYTYTLAFDFILLVIACWALFKNRAFEKSTAYKVIFIDGASDFFVASLWYLACAVLTFTNVSHTITYMVSDIAIICIAILTCRSFIRLFASKAERRVLPTAPHPAQFAKTTPGFGAPAAHDGPHSDNDSIFKSGILDLQADAAAQVRTIPMLPLSGGNGRVSPPKGYSVSHVGRFT